MSDAGALFSVAELTAETEEPLPLGRRMAMRNPSSRSNGGLLELGAQNRLTIETKNRLTKETKSSHK